ncbi:MAG: hypothetical protein IJ427_08275 [Lachnospiraceae bacterium]|nr:hypothetical protein [Lachnospiraceae bacterium]MBQ8548481.1 hypothetical protein [Lachnospiraceae bacterium]
MVRIYVENLSPEIKKGMKEWKYSAEELELIYARIMTRRAELMKGFKRAAIIMGAVVLLLVLMTAMSVGKMPNGNPAVAIAATVCLVPVCGLLLLLVKFTHVDRVRNQFMSLMKKYYPQYVHLMGKKSEEK